MLLKISFKKGILIEVTLKIFWFRGFTSNRYYNKGGKMAHYGNLQKIRNGKRTYAITPHIPGGFIKPDTLIKMGAVAKKYGGVNIWPKNFDN